MLLKKNQLRINYSQLAVIRGYGGQKKPHQILNVRS
jgi:hypothetical protein